jgi:membrane fusion protein (multidrug efflux system)
MSQPTETLTTDVSEPKNSNKRKRLFVMLALAIVVAGGGYCAYWKLIGSRYVSTDNAYTATEVASVTSQVAGQVAHVKVENSQQVKQGDVLVVLDDTDARLAMLQAQADLARARAQEAGAKSSLDAAKVDLQRRQALAGTGAVSGDDLTHIQNAASNAQASLDAATAGISLAQVRFDQAKIDLARTVIRSPVSGVVAQREVQLGQRVVPSIPLLSVVPVQDMYVDANFKEVQLEGVHPGQHVKLITDLYGSDVVFHGVVGGFDGGTGAAFAVIPAQNATGNWIKVVAHPLRVGLSMTATIDLQSKS